MANPKKLVDPTEAAMSAIQEALNLRQEPAQTFEHAKKVPPRGQVTEILERLARVSEQGAKNKLPGVNSDHSFLYQSGTPV